MLSFFFCWFWLVRSPNETKIGQEVSKKVVKIESKLLQHGLKGTRKGLLGVLGDHLGPPEAQGAKTDQKHSKKDLGSPFGTLLAPKILRRAPGARK